MTKIYQVKIENKKYPNEIPKRFNVVAGSCAQAIARTKKDVRTIEEVTSVELIAEA